MFDAPNVLIKLPDLEPTEKELIDEINKIEIAEARMGLIDQHKAAATRGDRWHHLDGDVEMQVNSFSFHYWGKRLGYECWQDKAFCREFRRDNPSVRIRNHSRNVTVSGFTPTKSSFHKSYR